MRSFRILAASLLLAACAAAPPPFEVESGAEKMDSAVVAYGSCVYQPKGVERVMVHREVYPVQTELEEGRFPVDFYYPPGYNFKRPLPTVIMVVGNVDYSSHVSYGCMMAASGFLAVAVHTKDNLHQYSDVRLESLLEQVLADAERLRIDTGRVAVYSTGLCAARALAVLMDRSAPVTPLVKCAVLASPLMYIGKAGFEYDTAAMNADIPMLIQHGSECEFWDVNRTTELFRAAAEEIGMDITYYEVEGGTYFWDQKDPTPAGIEGVKAQIAYLKKHL